MSVIACRVYEDRYEISADSICAYGWTQTRDRVKLVEVNGIVIGGSGRAEENSLFQLFAKTHTPSASTEAGILDFISEFSDWKLKKINNSQIENAYILGFENNVFQVYGWDIVKVTGYAAIGAGMDFALAALYLGHTTEKAIETAIELSMACEGPIITYRKFITKGE
jgi:ATP-dependent protease HslVU (ClpYQ) peptidase subunit